MRRMEAVNLTDRTLAARLAEVEAENLRLRVVAESQQALADDLRRQLRVIDLRDPGRENTPRPGGRGVKADPEGSRVSR